MKFRKKEKSCQQSYDHQQDFSFNNYEVILKSSAKHVLNISAVTML